MTIPSELLAACDLALSYVNPTLASAVPRWISLDVTDSVARGQKKDTLVPRHDDAYQIIKMALRSGHISAIREPKNLSRIDGKRPDG